MLAFSTDTITDASAAAVGQAMAERLRDDIVAHAAWTLVEEYTPGGGAATFYVFKCDSAISGLSDDFHAVIGRTIATGELRFAIGEGYNSGTHTLSRYVPVVSGSNVSFDSVGANPNTYVLTTVNLSGATNTPLYNTWTPGATSAKFWLIVDDDGFAVAFSGAVEGFIDLGAYISLADQTNNCPLMMVGHTNAGGVTRNPAVISQSIVGVAQAIKGGGTASFDAEQLGFRGDVRYDDALQATLRPVAEVCIVMNQNATNSRESYGWAIGKQKRMRYGGGSAPTGFVWGDSYELDGELWVPYKASDLRIWNTGVAA